MKNAEVGNLSVHMGRIVIVVVMLLCAQGGYAESPGPEPIQVPDVRANIMKMLREGRGSREEVEEDLFAKAERQEKDEKRVAEPVEIEPQSIEPVTKPVETVPEDKEAVTLPKAEGPPVELPVKEIVIEDLDDLKKLAEELKRAKKRQAERQ